MLFNSLEFLIFLPCVFLLYWGVFRKNIKARNLFLLIISYIFYGWWDWRFLSLIFISSIIDYIVGNQMAKTEEPKKRKLLLFISLFTNLGILIFFKYSNFFVESFISSFSLVGVNLSYSPLNIILPVGISFYTFQTLSYSIDIYNRKFQPINDPISFFAFVSFFPQLVAGPIERAKDLLPQFETVKKFDYEDARKGMLLILGGFFKKIVVADRLGLFINQAFGNISEASGISLVIAVVFFAFQLYLDFSAYSDIAIGVAKLFGFNLSVNFNRPYLASSFSDFWKRWHISLSSWFRDYIYFPLGGNRKGKRRTVINVMIVFILSGLWHGASWNFVIWGGLNGLYLVLLDRFFIFSDRNTIKRILSAIFISSMWALSLVFFRLHTFSEAIQVFQNLGIGNTEALYNFGLNKTELQFSFYLLVGIMIFEIISEKFKQTLYQLFIARHLSIRWGIYLIFMFAILLLGSYGLENNDNSFIYFQF